MKNINLPSSVFKHIPLAIANIGALIFLTANDEFLLFELIIVTQLILAILLLAIHRQSTRKIGADTRWTKRTLALQILFLGGFCATFFLVDIPWSLGHSWQDAATLLVGKASEVTIMLGIVIGAMTVVGCLLLRKRGT